MFLRSKYLIGILFMMLGQQVMSQSSNINLPILIDLNDVKTTKLNNGVELNVILQDNYNGFDTTRWKSNVNKPTVLITQKGDYLYNSKVILSSNSLLCAGGKHIATPLDFEILFKSVSSFEELKINGFINSKSDYLWFSPSCKTQAFFDFSKGYLYATSKSIHYEREWSEELMREDSTQQLYFYDLASFDFVSVPLLSSAPIRCAYNSYEDYFQLEKCSYKDLRPESFFELTNNIRSSLEFQKKLKSSVKVQLIFSYNQEGELKKKTISNPNVDFINNSLYTALKSTLQFPFYKNLKIQTTDTLDITITPNSKNIERDRLNLSLTSPQFQNYIKDRYLKPNLDNCINMNAKAIYKLPNNIVSFEDSYNANYTFPSLKKVKCPGPINSLFAIIPGFGINQFRNTFLISKKPQKVILGFSISTAAIAITSKLISINYYNKFTSNLMSVNAPRNYQLANSTQKIFVASSALYAGLALVDFTWTFSLGVKSKHYQHEANKELRLMHKQNLWL
jgi:hypothetical protein